VVDHDLRAGGRITFFMTGTEGERHDSTWEVIAADPPRHLELRDADVDDDGRPTAVVSMRNLIEYLGEVHSREMLSIPPDPHQARSRSREGA
jgi:uncharacterized protein YndB with AHSA1/START domain